ncbi:MAG: integrase, partial [Betaproteobacteria bacterium]
TRSAPGSTTAHLKPEQFLFPSRITESPHLSTRQYSRIVGCWVGHLTR